MFHYTFNFTGFFGYARFTEGSLFAMEKLDMRCIKDCPPIFEHKEDPPAYIQSTLCGFSFLYEKREIVMVNVAKLAVK